MPLVHLSIVPFLCVGARRELLISERYMPLRGVKDKHSGGRYVVSYERCFWFGAVYDANNSCLINKSGDDNLARQRIYGAVSRLF